MSTVAQVTDALKKVLKTRGMTYAALARQLNLSEGSVKRLFSAGSFTLRRLEQICGVLELDFYDVAKIARSQVAKGTRLSLAQEEALASNHRLLVIFHLLLNEWTIDEITNGYRIPKREILRLMRRLHELRLIELGPSNRPRLLTASNIEWRNDGPVRQAYQPYVLAEFFDSSFEARNQVLHFDSKELGAASIAVMTRKIDKLLSDFDELAEIDAPLVRSQKQSVGIILALRPYVLSLFKELKRQKLRATWPSA
jgi:transcriptional regulator with XRE-family HTH domain